MHSSPVGFAGSGTIAPLNGGYFQLLTSNDGTTSKCAVKQNGLSGVIVFFVFQWKIKLYLLIIVRFKCLWTFGNVFSKCWWSNKNWE